MINRNLIGVGPVGCMTADQKKKLLWGNKKSTTAEEVGHRWDTTLFSDRERQEKFNKLMGVKGEVKVEQKPENEDQKQKELQMDLEKQYTAGLRRRDGRTVGLEIESKYWGEERMNKGGGRVAGRKWKKCLWNEFQYCQACNDCWGSGMESVYGCGWLQPTSLRRNHSFTGHVFSIKKKRTTVRTAS
ncbi:unnamed protein product [Prunus armeniaca]|uniref:Small acidic protein-like domain-containing protein n=1 Tax=Prunus armeniaca TaxID=36596 RepID=A0A6J5VDG3_PRUAR|nr:unnamed protein product [Prunus armeniaca]